jgi:hypothetical protein
MKYRVLIGLNYPPNDTRAEPGDIVDNIPPGSLAWLLKAGALEPAEPRTPKPPPDDEPDEKEEG